MSATSSPGQEKRVSVAGGVAEMWADYKRSGDRDARNRLVLNYAPLVKFVAGRLASGLPHTIEQADLVSYGMFGLINAIDRFDPDLGPKFETYAVTRIRGAILDELRSVDWVPRSLRAKSRAVQKAYSNLEGDLGRNPTDAEVAKELGITEAALADIFTKISFFGLVALDETMSGSSDDDRLTVGDTIADGGPSPTAALEEREDRELLHRAIGRLPEREQLVLNLYYFENFTLAEIGQALAVTESRVCQIHTKAVIRLRSKLGAPEPPKRPVSIK